jgi:hypothetical protein
MGGKMRKTLVIIFMLIIFGTISVQADNWEYLPSGVNYIDPDNFEKRDIADLTCFFTKEPFLIKENTPYTFYSPAWPYIHLVSLDITFYDFKGLPLAAEVKYLSFLDDCNCLKTTFTTPVGARYLGLAFTIIPYYSEESIEFYYLYEGQDFYEIDEYQGPDPDFLPTMQNTVGHYRTNIDNPVSLEVIKSALKAIDDVDGDLSAAIEVITDNYTPNRNRLGIYDIVFRATDRRLNSTDFTVLVEILDLAAPVISGSNHIIVSPFAGLALTTLIEQLQITDNYDQEMTIAVESDNYTENSQKIGTYAVIFSATDSSGNKSCFELTVEVKDQEKPVILALDEYHKAAHQTITLSEILAGVTAVDAVDGDVTDSIKVIRDDYSVNAYKPGSWRIDLEAQDKSGNVAQHTLYVRIYDQKGPLFLIDTKLITIVLEEDAPTLGRVLESLNGEEFAYRTLLDEYTGNEKTPGRYRVVVEAESELLEYAITVQGEEEPQEPTFWQKIGNFFRELFRKIGDIFN